MGLDFLGGAARVGVFAGEQHIGIDVVAVVPDVVISIHFFSCLNY